MIKPWPTRAPANLIGHVLRDYLILRLEEEYSHEEALRVAVGALVGGEQYTRSRCLSLLNTVDRMLEGYR